MKRMTALLLFCILLTTICPICGFASGPFDEIMDQLRDLSENKYGNYSTLDELLLYWQNNGSAGLNLEYYYALSHPTVEGEYILEYNDQTYTLSLDEMHIVKQWIDGKYSPSIQAESDNSDLLTIPDDVRVIIERQERFSEHYKQTAEQRLKEYWEVTITDFVLSCEEDSEAVKIITIHMKWDVWNSEDRTRKMLTMYSDDMAAYLKESNPDTPIHTICIVWEAPYILEKGPVAKYEYYDAGSYMMHSNSSGYLYSD